MCDFSERLQSLRRHHYRQSHLDELLVLVDGAQGAADVVGDIG